MPPQAPPSQKVLDARSRVETYLKNVRKLPYDTCGIANDTLGHIFNVTVVTAYPDGTWKEHNCRSAKELIPILEEMLDECESCKKQKSRFFVVEDFSATVVKILGGYLDVPPDFFISHASGGETKVGKESYQAHYKVRFPCRNHRSALTYY